jgi:hypothetical protein
MTKRGGNSKEDTCKEGEKRPGVLIIAEREAEHIKERPVD